MFSNSEYSFPTSNHCCYDVAVATGVVLLVRIAIEVLRLRHVFVRLAQSGHDLLPQYNISVRESLLTSGLSKGTCIFYFFDSFYIH
jgi:hypothetical protein